VTGRVGRAGAEAGTADTPAASPAAGLLPRLAGSPLARHVTVLLAYLAAGIALTWPRATYLTGLLPQTRDAASYVWAFWWVTHQVTHLGSPWTTGYMAAPVGIQLGFNTMLPLPALILTPVTLAFGPSASFTLLTIVTPGLLCYAMYRVARLWLRSGTGALAAGAFFGLSAMLAWQDWYHINIAAGSIFLPLTLEAAVRFRRRPGTGQGLVLGAVLGASVLVNQESAVMALIVAVLAVIPWLIRHPRPQHLAALGIAAGAALIIASPQLIAMATQASAAGASPVALAHSDLRYGVGVTNLFAPTQQVAHVGLTGLAQFARERMDGEAMPLFGSTLSAMALLGLAVSWRRRSAWLLAGLWLGCASLALGVTLWVGGVKLPHLYPEVWHGVHVSGIMPYSWLIRIPGLSAFREADRFAVLGLLPAALLAGAAVDWLRYHARPLIVIVAACGLLEAGWYGSASRGTMPTALTKLDAPIAADRSGSIVLDVPFGLRGGLQVMGPQFAPEALVLATADEHPRSIAYSSWIPRSTSTGILGHAFYAQLIRTEHGIPLAPGMNANGQQVSRAQLASAARDVRRLGIGWVLLWPVTRPPAGASPDAEASYQAALMVRAIEVRYLTATGFRLSYRADGVTVFRPGWRPGR